MLLQIYHRLNKMAFCQQFLANVMLLRLLVMVFFFVCSCFKKCHNKSVQMLLLFVVFIFKSHLCAMSKVVQ